MWWRSAPPASGSCHCHVTRSGTPREFARANRQYRSVTTTDETSADETTTVETPRGPARVMLHRPDGRAHSLLVLGHGAAGDVTAPDLRAVTAAAVVAGVAVALVTQPYRVAGRRTPPNAPALDEAWVAVVTAIRAGAAGPVAPRRLPLILGGRSSGARVACRTATALGAVGVVALAFPLHPPGRPGVSRAGEFDERIPTLVINGDADSFGVPEPGTNRVVIVHPGARHDLRKDAAAVGRAVVDWLAQHRWAKVPRDGQTGA